MTVPTTYTETTLASFMHAELRDVATTLAWSVAGGSYAAAVEETLIAYGISTASDATNIAKLRALARREVWRAVMTAVSLDYDYSDAGVSFSRSQMYAQASTMHAQASAAAMPYVTNLSQYGSAAVDTEAQW